MGSAYVGLQFAATVAPEARGDINSAMVEVAKINAAETAGVAVGEVAGIAITAARFAPKKTPNINWGQQEKHLPGHNNYRPGRSTMTSDPTKLAKKAGTRQQIGKNKLGTPGSKERVDFGETIGTHIDQAGNASPTTRGIIHYGKKGIHIVPARPKR